MDAKRRKLVQRVINLAQVSPSSATPGEVENAQRIGRRLIARHEITLAECEEVHAEDLAAERVRLGRRPPPPPPQAADQWFGFGSPTATTGGVYGNTGIRVEFRFG